MPANPLQKQAVPGEWFYAIMAMVRLAQASDELKWGTELSPLQWPRWLPKKIRREIVRAGKEWAGYVMAQQARQIAALKREVERLRAGEF